MKNIGTNPKNAAGARQKLLRPLPFLIARKLEIKPYNYISFCAVENAFTYTNC